jgi:Transposase
MASMPTSNDPVIVMGGIDCHADTHHAVALDGCGRRLGDAQFPATGPGYHALHAWLAAFGQVATAGVESTSGYGAGLTRHLLAQGVHVVEVNQPHPHTRRRRGKSDPIDAEAAARKALSGEATAIPKDTTGIVEAIRLLRVARAGAVKAHAAALNQLRELLVTAPEALRRQITGQRKTLPGQAGGRVQPAAVVPGDPGEDRGAGLGSGAVAAATDQLDLERGEERLGGGVVQARPGPAHRLAQPEPLTRRGAGSAGVLLRLKGSLQHRLLLMGVTVARRGPRQGFSSPGSCGVDC